ncbi:hypothetical protein [uncultured Chryseobacterium sp.]|uniref:hypothetical protein n=1 Tax=uncultured Chryseobacterium sp. TaxID=259322 RepID=UPI0025FC14E2|nr:hypothetical protein [uncultured Chryseobacterium sp.]
MKIPQRYFLETRFLSYSTVVIIVLVVLSVWISGTGSHRSLFQNSILSISILAVVLFLFISLGLYYGLKLKDNIGPIVNREKITEYKKKRPKVDSFDLPDISFGGETGCGELIFSVILWILFSVVLIFLLYFLGIFFWVVILLFTATLYWIFFRALRLVFKNSRYCKGKLLKSFGFGFFYSFLYISWIYGIIFLVHYLK